MEVVDILPGFQTDHFIPLLYLNFSAHERGPGFWKFNTSLLEDDLFKDQLGRIIEIEIAQEYKDPAIKWEVIKLAIRNYTLQQSTIKKKLLP